MKRKKEFVSTLLYFAGVMCLTWLIVTYVGQRTEVSGTSMTTTLADGDNLIVDKISYRFREPKRFDIIVFPWRYEADTYYIKRIIGMPGESLWITENGEIYINGSLLEEDYDQRAYRAGALGSSENPVILGEDEYFVMGDNRNNSTDSRKPEVGNIKREEIIGKAVFRIWPLDVFGALN